MDLMKSNAAFLSDKLHLTVSNHYKQRTYLLLESQSIVFEGITLTFERQDVWRLHFMQQMFECPFDASLHLTIDEFESLQLKFSRLTPSMFNTGVLSYEHEVVIGSDFTSDGIIDLSFEGEEVFVKASGDEIAYRFVHGASCAVNGVISAPQGQVKAPALIEKGTLKLFVGKDFMIFNHCVLSVLHPEEIKLSEIEAVRYAVSEAHFIEKPDRINPQIQPPQFVSLPESSHVSLMSMGPMLTMSCASFLSAYLSYQKSGSAAGLIMPAVMIFSALFWPLCGMVFSKLRLRRLKKRRRMKYLNECSELSEHLKEAKEIIKRQRLNPEIMKESELWQIREDHPQYLCLPLGIGSESTQWKSTSASAPDISETECQKALYTLQKEAEKIEDVLVSSDLKRVCSVAFVTSLRQRTLAARRLLCAMASLMDLSSVNYVLFCEDEAFNWQFRPTALFQNNERCTIVDASVSVQSCEQLLSQFDLKQTVCFVLDKDRFLKLNRTLRQRVLTVYFLSYTLTVPSECKKVIQINQDDVLLPDKVQLIFSNTAVLQKRIMECTLHRPRKAAFSKRSSLGFLDLTPVTKENQILNMWQSNEELCALLGVDAHDERIELNLSEHADGPHGLVGGATGSGKSALLLNLLLSLAVRCSVDTLQMLIIDYKGGTLFQQLSYRGLVLPHLAGCLSNQSSMIGRALASIGYECARRQKLFEKDLLASTVYYPGSK